MKLGLLFGLFGFFGCLFAPFQDHLDVDIMPKHIKPQMTEKTVRALGRAPCFANKTIDVGAIHSGRVIEWKHGIMATFFEFALTGHAGASAFLADMYGVGENFLNHFGVTHVHVACESQVVRGKKWFGQS